MIRGFIAVVLLGGVFMMKANLASTLRLIAGAHAGWVVAGALGTVIGELLTTLKWQYILQSAGLRVGCCACSWHRWPARSTAAFSRGPWGATWPGSSWLHRTRAARRPRLPQPSCSATRAGAMLAVANFAAWLSPVPLHVFPQALAALNDLRTWFA